MRYVRGSTGYLTRRKHANDVHRCIILMSINVYSELGRGVTDIVRCPLTPDGWTPTAVLRRVGYEIGSNQGGAAYLCWRDVRRAILAASS